MTAPVLARQVVLPDGSTTRRYVHPLSNEQVPSVTSVLRQMAKPKVESWKLRTAAEYAVMHMHELDGMRVREKVDWIAAASERESKPKAALGDVVHELVDCWSTGRPFPEVPKEVAPFASRFIDFLLDVKPVFIENECTVWSRTHQYAGTADFIVRVGDKTYMSDLKSGKNLWPEVGMQTAALAGGDFILRPDGTEEEIPPLDGIAALHLRPRSWTWQVLDHQKENFQAFLACRALLRWETEFAPAVLGEA